MTRIALLADIHGNLPALEAVLRDLQQIPVDQILVAGDLIGRGPFAVEVLERVARAGWPLIRGNHELYVLDYDTPRAPDSWRTHTMTPWLRDRLGTNWIRTMACWPDTLCLRFPDAPALRVFHGTPQSPFTGIFHSDSDAKVRSILTGIVEQTVVLAHTHLPLDRVVDDWHIINPGSIGLPLDGIFAARYMILDGDSSGWRATLRQVPFDYDALYAAFERIDIGAAWGIAGHIVLREFQTARPQFTPAIRWHAEHHPDTPWNDELWEAFINANPWRYQPISYHVNISQPHYILDDGTGVPLDVRRATAGELPIVLDLLNDAAHWLADRGIDQWRSNSFSARRLHESIERGEVYLVSQDGDDVATLSLHWHDPIVWGERPADAVYVHKLVVRRTAAGQHTGLRLLRWAEQIAAEADKSFVRLDCLDTNAALCHYYERAGFTSRGHVAGEGWSARLFERAVHGLECESDIMRT